MESESTNNILSGDGIGKKCPDVMFKGAIIYREGASVIWKFKYIFFSGAHKLGSPIKSTGAHKLLIEELELFSI